MKASKAKELLQMDINHPGSVAKADLIEAEQLGVEALIFFKTHRHRVIPPYDVLLPSEDPE